MKINVFLHKDIVDVLKLIDDDLSTAVNKILNAAYTNGFDLQYLPVCRARDNTCSRYCINVTCQDYINDILVCKQNPTTYSLRRILYYIIENEIYAQLGIVFETNNSKTLNEFGKYIVNAQDTMYIALHYGQTHLLNGKFLEQLRICLREINTLLEEIANAK